MQTQPQTVQPRHSNDVDDNIVFKSKDGGLGAVGLLIILSREFIHQSKINSHEIP